MSTSTALTLREIDGEPLVRDTDLAERLEYASPDELRRLISRHRDELVRYGVSRQSDGKPGPKGGRPSKTTYLNEAQATLLVMFSGTAKAADVRQEIVLVYQAWRHGRLGPQQFAIPRTLPEALRLAAERVGEPGLVPIIKGLSR